MIDSTILTFEQAKVLSLRVKAGRLAQTLAGYRLQFELEVQALEPIQPPASLRLPGEVYVRRADASMSPRLVGSPRLERLGAIYPSSNPAARITESATLDLSPAAVEAMEDLRNGGGLTFQLQFSPILVIEGRSYLLAHAQIECDINQAAWLQLLDQSGFRRTLLLELSYPDSKHQPDMAIAISRVEEARSRFLSGQYGDTVAKCREALEALTHSAVASEPTPKIQRSQTKPERWLLVQGAITHLTHLAHHADPLAAATSWDREEARAVLSMTAAVVKAGIRD